MKQSDLSEIKELLTGLSYRWQFPKNYEEEALESMDSLLTRTEIIISKIDKYLGDS